MSLQLFPHFPSLSIFSPKSLPSFLPRCSSRSTSAAASSGSRSSGAGSNGVAVLWFKHDLRIDDHPGLVAASKFTSIVPLYVFDHRILSRFSDEMLEIVLSTVEYLRKSLRDRGSDLMIRFGRAETIIQRLVNEVKATNVFAEAEVEYELCKMIDVVNETLEMGCFPDVSPDLTLWKTPFYDIETLEDIPSSHDDFLKRHPSITSAIPPPKLPGIQADLEWGSLPSSEHLKEFMDKTHCKSRETWYLIRNTSSESVLHDKIFKQGGSNQNCSDRASGQSRRLGKSIFVMKKGGNLVGGTDAVLNALAAYLRYTEGSNRDDWREIHELVRGAETRDGASFIKLFTPALSLGVVSRRRIYFEANNYEKERNAGFLSPFGYSTFTVKAAVDAVCSMEWYWLMGLKNQQSNQGVYTIRIWRWKGFLVQLLVARVQLYFLCMVLGLFLSIIVII